MKHRPVVAKNSPVAVCFPKSFNSKEEEEFLNCCVIAEASGWSPPLGVVKDVFLAAWGKGVVERVRGLGGAFFAIFVPSESDRCRMIQAGRCGDEVGSFRLRPWSPGFGAAPRPSRTWQVRVVGLPIHWLLAGGVREVLASFGEVIEVLGCGFDADGRSTKDVLLAAPPHVSLPGVITVSHGSLSCSVHLHAEEVGFNCARSWAEVATESIPSTSASHVASRTAWRDKVLGMAPQIAVGACTAAAQDPKSAARHEGDNVCEKVASRTASVEVDRISGPAQGKSLQGCQAVGEGNVKTGVDVAQTKNRSDVVVSPGEPDEKFELPMGFMRGPRTVLDHSDSDCPFGPGSIGPEWAWAWWGKDPGTGSDLFRPIHLGFSPNDSRGSETRVGNHILGESFPMSADKETESGLLQAGVAVPMPTVASSLVAPSQDGPLEVSPSTIVEIADRPASLEIGAVPGPVVSLVVPHTTVPPPTTGEVIICSRAKSIGMIVHKDDQKRFVDRIREAFSDGTPFPGSGRATRCLSWNIRGLHDLDKQRALADVIKEQRVEVCCIQETKFEVLETSVLRAVGGDRLSEMVVKNAVGSSGGLLTVWDGVHWEAVDSKVGTFSVSVLLRCKSSGWSWICSNVYGPADGSGREILWAELSEAKATWQAPWCLLGDFNITRFVEDRNRVGSISAPMRLFSEWIAEEALLDVPLANQSFTWSSMRAEPAMARLDRVLICPQWEDKFPGCDLIGLPRITSDHVPLLLSTRSAPPCKRVFRFESWWLECVGFEDMVRESWNTNVERLRGARRVAFKLRRLKQCLKYWGRQEKLRRSAKKEQCSRRIAELDLVEETTALSEAERGERILSRGGVGGRWLSLLLVPRPAGDRFFTYVTVPMGGLQYSGRLMFGLVFGVSGFNVLPSLLRLKERLKMDCPKE
ncbi:hypothetical protein QJS10_CPA09g00724 [Acorus calamus]|uniref:Endonuclease/exonuclease/phosphatase domain-containing protein n=1 Tax=Acorus calamus TaxID=4465 RepID=A0AAV9E498_ACOCL|nr:hypothetical protein QJS10_CPA09g00724 [Acorus calamus]